MNTENKIYNGIITSIKMVKNKDGVTTYRVSFNDNCVYVQKKYYAGLNENLKEGGRLYFKGSFIKGLFLVSEIISKEPSTAIKNQMSYHRNVAKRAMGY